MSQTESEPLAELQLFFGQVSEHTAQVYAALDLPNSDASLQLEGEISGPFSPSGATLPATTPLRDKPGPSLLCAAVVPDPCYWTTDLPVTYSVRVSLMEGDREVASTVRPFAFRPLGASGPSFYFAHRRWVLRAIEPTVDETDERWESWRLTETTLLLADVKDEFLEQASQQGVRVLLDLRTMEQPRESVLRAAQQACVIGILLDPARIGAHTDNPRRWAPNLLLLSEPQGELNADWIAPDWADAVWLDAKDVPRVAALPQKKALVVFRPGAGSDEERRAAVDRLQAELAKHGQFAGYVVTTST